ncbi:FRG domain-containing protein [Flavisolibacter nicotianae]|uniref:FRG domain-containing protein n=1 Tax=Flavisolibacter nicotianae TaxID=2364882 RepID=UPI000EB12C15|nr:FRG domain-containing protein [Flavisolibacter nicotianae]
MNQYHFSTERLSSWNEFSQVILQFSERWAFRGQANANWVLNNAIERTDFIRHHKGIEAQFVAEFQRGALNYLTKDQTPGHLIEWLALMQHHGAPTRLLDLSRSPFIAAYFAYELALLRDDHHVSVWCLNIDHLRSKALEVLSQEFGEALKETHNRINEKLFELIFYQNNKSLVFPVEPFRMNRRYSLQQSVFVSTGNSEQPFMNQLYFLQEDMPKAVVKLEIPAGDKKQAMRDLLKMNLHRASLFPDLDGYALSMRLRYNNMKAPEEIEKEKQKKEKDSNYPYFP